MRDIPVPRGALTALVEGDIEAVDKILKIVRIRVRYDIAIPPGKREAAERAVATHATKCPAANSVRGCIELDIDAEMRE